jgi:ubiquinone/menaquinone biosynthesis C-methylase UbiE
MSNSMIKRAYNLLGAEYYNTRKYKSGGSYFYNELLEFPTTSRLIGEVKGKDILDLGCGPGIHSKKLSDKGAKIKGIDISKELIEIAKKEAPKAGFKIGDINKLPYRDAEFDIVFASLVMGHLKEWDKVLSEVKRVLRKNGFFVFSIYNPVTEKFVKTRWFFKKFRILKGYFKEGLKKTVWKNNKKTVAKIVHYHKTYGTIIRLIIKSGFEVIDYEDCKPPELAKKDFPKEYEWTLNYPRFCVWKVGKK